MMLSHGEVGRITVLTEGNRTLPVAIYAAAILVLKAILTTLSTTEYHNSPI